MRPRPHCSRSRGDASALASFANGGVTASDRDPQTPPARLIGMDAASSAACCKADFVPWQERREGRVIARISQPSLKFAWFRAWLKTSPRSTVPVSLKDWT